VEDIINLSLAHTSFNPNYELDITPEFSEVAVGNLGWAPNESGEWMREPLNSCLILRPRNVVVGPRPRSFLVFHYATFGTYK